MGKGRTPCCEKGRVKKGPWSQDEDLKLISFIQRHGHSNWRSLPKLAGLARCGKSCRLRWVNYLRPDVKRGSLSPDEEETIIRLQSLLGNKWSKIASHLPGRTDNEIKNIWNTHLKKRSTDNKSHHFHGQGVAPPFSSSDCTALESNIYHYHDAVAQTISYDEPSLVDLWDSLLLDDDRLNNPDISGGKAMIQGECSAINNDYGGSSQGVVSEANHQLEAVSNEGLLKMDNTMESYLEIMAWPSSPPCYSFSGF